MGTLKQLQLFRSTAIAGSVRGAADRLGAAPSAVSQQIRALEQETGLELFTRTGRRLALTPVGRELLAETETVFEAVGAWENRVAELRAARAHRLVVGYFSSAGARWIADLVAYLEFSHPDLSVRLELTDGGIREDGQDLQLVVTGEEELQVPASMASELLLVDPYVAAIPRGHAFARSAAVTLHELTALPWIDNDDLASSDGRCRQVFLDACRISGVNPSFRHEAHDYRTALDMVDRGLGVTVLPRLALSGVGPNTAILPIAGTAPRRRIHLVWTRDSPHPEVIADALSALRDLVTEEAGQDHQVSS